MGEANELHRGGWQFNMRDDLFSRWFWAGTSEKEHDHRVGRGPSDTQFQRINANRMSFGSGIQAAYGR